MGEALRSRSLGIARKRCREARLILGGMAPISRVWRPERAVSIGAGALVVSNHGGRPLNRVPAPIAVLREIESAVGGRAQVILDGGVQRGTDILKALALCASSCSIGSAF